MKNKKPVIVCGGKNGRAVIFGWSEYIPNAGEQMCLYNARMVLRWGYSSGLFGFAANGPVETTRLTPAVEMVKDEVIRQVLTVTDEAAKKIADWPSYEH